MLISRNLHLKKKAVRFVSNQGHLVLPSFAAIMMFNDKLSIKEDG